MVARRTQGARAATALHDGRISWVIRTVHQTYSCSFLKASDQNKSPGVLLVNVALQSALRRRRLCAALLLRRLRALLTIIVAPLETVLQIVNDGGVARLRSHAEAGAIEAADGAVGRERRSADHDGDQKHRRDGRKLRRDER